MKFSTSGAVKMTLDVIIPVHNQRSYTQHLLECIGNNTIIPNTIFVIDNNSSDATEQTVKKFDLPVVYCKLDRNAGVNASWNLGISMSVADLVCFLNNDLLIPDFFFQKIQLAFSLHSKLGLAVPLTITSQDALFLARPPEGIGISVPLTKREGWAFTMRRELLHSIGPIPFATKNFFGDDWFYQGCLKAGYWASKMRDIPVFHYGSVTVNATGVIHTLRKEREQWKSR